MSSQSIRCGTRRSPLALWQARWVQSRLAVATQRSVELVLMETSGDRVRGALADHGGKGLFVKELDAALLSGAIDCAVHSLKDIPGIVAPGVCIAAVSPREDARDVLISATGTTLAALPSRARVGTSSPRRRWQLMQQRSDLVLVELRGNVATRLERVARGEMDAVVVALAGVTRLGLSMVHAQVLPIDIMIPAVGQGTMAVTVRADDTAMRDLMRTTCHDPHNAVIVAAERALLAEVGGDCYTPLAGYAQWVTTATIELRAFLATPDGRGAARQHMSGSAKDVEQIGRTMARQLLERIS